MIVKTDIIKTKPENVSLVPLNVKPVLMLKLVLNVPTLLDPYLVVYVLDLLTTTKEKAVNPVKSNVKPVLMPVLVLLVKTLLLTEPISPLVPVTTLTTITTEKNVNPVTTDVKNVMDPKNVPLVKTLPDLLMNVNVPLTNGITMENTVKIVLLFVKLVLMLKLV